ncbi:MAG: glutaredoxin family protein [Solirubrobacteraceae bacterium]|jgi:glutaredoxin
MRSVVIYGRRGCCLCDDALEVLQRVRARTPFALRTLDIDADDALHAAYLERIPVVCIDGREAFELFVDEAEFELAVADRRPGAVPPVE